MALFKIFRGQASQLSQVPHTQGYAYFTEDDGKLYIDISSDAGSVKGTRVAVNASIADEARVADALKNSSGTGTIDIDDIFLKNMIATIAQGGTGRNSLTANALLIGNGTNAIKMVALTAGNVAVGDATNGVKGLSGTGALYSLTTNAPQFGTLPVAAGGTGQKTLTANALLAGNGTSGIKSVPVSNGNILVGDSTNVVRGLSGTGAVYSTTSGSPQMGTLPLAAGGTGGTSATTARSSLQVYSKTETDNKVATKTTTVAYNFTLTSSGWNMVEGGGSSSGATVIVYQQDISISNLNCGGGNVPPIITCTNNQQDYNKINYAIADVSNKKITFTIQSGDIPARNIDITVIDVIK